MSYKRKYAVKEIAELYICVPAGTDSRLVKQLNGYVKIDAGSGLSQTVSVVLSKIGLSFIGKVQAYC